MNEDWEEYDRVNSWWTIAAACFVLIFWVTVIVAICLLLWEK